MNDVSIMAVWDIHFVTPLQPSVTQEILCPTHQDTKERVPYIITSTGGWINTEETEPGEQQGVDDSRWKWAIYRGLTAGLTQRKI